MRTRIGFRGANAPNFVRTRSVFRGMSARFDSWHPSGDGCSIGKIVNSCALSEDTTVHRRKYSLKLTKIQRSFRYARLGWILFQQYVSDIEVHDALTGTLSNRHVSSRIMIVRVSVCLLRDAKSML